MRLAPGELYDGRRGMGLRFPVCGTGDLRRNPDRGAGGRCALLRPPENGGTRSPKSGPDREEPDMRKATAERSPDRKPVCGDGAMCRRRGEALCFLLLRQDESAAAKLPQHKKPRSCAGFFMGSDENCAPAPRASGSFRAVCPAAAVRNGVFCIYNIKSAKRRIFLRGGRAENTSAAQKYVNFSAKSQTGRGKVKKHFLVLTK